MLAHTVVCLRAYVRLVWYINEMYDSIKWLLLFIFTLPIAADLFRSDNSFKHYYYVQMWWFCIKNFFFASCIVICFFLSVLTCWYSEQCVFNIKLNKPLDNLNCSAWLNNSHNNNSDTEREMLTARCPQTLFSALDND